MPRILPTTITSAFSSSRSRLLVAGQRNFSSAPVQGVGKQNSQPGWEGRSGDDHVVNRQPTDIQAESSHEAMKSKEEGKEGSQAISQKDEGNHNKRAKEEHPEAPEPVIGMNEERGSKGH